MYDTLVAAVTVAIQRSLPLVEPLLRKALANVARSIIQQAKDGTFPDRYKALEPFFDAAAEELLKLLPAE